VARQVARAASSQRAFSRRNRAQAAIYRHPLPEAAPYGPTTVRPPSYVRARSPALVLSPGIYNTLCFPSAICLESSTPSSLTLLSRVLFLVIIPRARAPRPLFPPPPSLPVPLPRRLHFLSVGRSESLNERTPRRIWPGFFLAWIFLVPLLISAHAKISPRDDYVIVESHFGIVV